MLNDNNKILSSVIKKAFSNMMKEVHTTIPGKIVSFDPITQSAEVQICINRIFVTIESNGSETEREEAVAVLTNVPVIFLRGGGWCITFPVKEGDECIVHFSERSIDTWRKNGDVQTPNTWRLHSYSDAICQVGLSSEPNVITDFDNENTVIRNEEGDVRIELRSDKEVHIETPIKVKVTTAEVEVEASTSLKVTSPTMDFIASSNVTFETPIATFTGDVQIDGTSTADEDHISNGISGATHTHEYRPGSGTPTPTEPPA